MASSIIDPREGLRNANAEPMSLRESMNMQRDAILTSINNLQQKLAALDELIKLHGKNDDVERAFELIDKLHKT